METFESYLDRKFTEMMLLDRCLASPFELKRPESAAVAVEEKLRLAADLRAEQALRGWNVTETARSPTQLATAGAFEFRYGYQRADLQVRGPAIYPALASSAANVVQQTIYTSSGMSAMAALLTALLRLRSSVEMRLAPGGYTETHELIESFGSRVRIRPLDAGTGESETTTGAVRVVLIDSSVRAGSVAYRGIPMRDVDLVIFDTTCYWRASGRIRRLIDWAVQSKLPLALVRSHAKLDCLGVEFGRLGSLATAAPRNALSSRRLELVTALSVQARNSVRLFGAAPALASFPPFTGSRQFDRCSVARIAAIIRNNRRMARVLSARLGGAGTVSEYQHGLYLTLTPGGELSIESARKLAGALCADLASSAVPVSHAGSFGFDFVAIDGFADPLSRRNVLRIAASDVPRFCIEKVADGIARWWLRRASALRTNAGAAWIMDSAA